MRVIPVNYKGRPFRSMTEARWAIFLDAMGIKWEYEKDGYSINGHLGYIPDFYLPELNAWLEVKGEMKEIDKLKISEFVKQKGEPLIIGYGNIEFKAPQLGFPKSVNFDRPDMNDQIIQCTMCRKIYFSRRLPETICPVCGTINHPHEAIAIGAITDARFTETARFKGVALTAYNSAISAQNVRGQDGKFTLQIKPPKEVKVCMICGSVDDVRDLYI